MRIDRFARSVADGASIVREIVGRDQIDVPGPHRSACFDPIRW